MKRSLRALVFALAPAAITPAAMVAAEEAVPRPATQAANSGIAQSASELARQMNRFCKSMHATYNKMEEFDEAYREAYELLELSKQISEAANAGQSITELLQEFDGEIHHVEHHISEFSAAPGGPSRESRDAVAKGFEDVEATLEGMLKQAGVARKKKPGHDHGDEKPVASVSNTAQLAPAAKELAVRMNRFCNAMHRTYNGMPEFEEAYREAYELLQLSKQIDTATNGGTIEGIRDLISEFDGEIHHVEHHITEFASTQNPANTAGQVAVSEGLEQVEDSLRGMMKQLGIQSKGPDGHKHEAGGEGSAKNEIPFSQLARNLSEKAGSFCNSLKHNFSESPEFDEAYKEAYELYEVSKKIEDLAKSNKISKECSDLLKEFDGEIHHLEEHLKGLADDPKATERGTLRAGRKLSELEQALHATMTRAGIKRKHAKE
jgi:hypothetical protein